MVILDAIHVMDTIHHRSMLNSDSEMYFGSNIGNYGGRWSELYGCNGREHSICIEVPPLAVVGFKLNK